MPWAVALAIALVLAGPGTDPEAVPLGAALAQERQLVAVAYLRVSSPAQQRHGKNLNSQLDDVRKYCRSKGYRLEAIYKDILTGRRIDRVEYHKLLARIERPGIDIVVTFEVARFGRDEAGISGAWLAAKCKARGIRVETSKGAEYDFDNPEDRLRFGLMCLLASYEVDVDRWRYRRGQEKGHERGCWVTSVPPFGYKAEGPRGDRVLVPDGNAPIVRELYRRYAAGASAHELTRWLAPKGLSKRHGRRDVLMKWSIMSVGYVLDNPVYMGKVPFAGKWRKGQHEPIVNPALWRRVQRRRAHRASFFLRNPRGIEKARQRT